MSANGNLTLHLSNKKKRKQNKLDSDANAAAEESATSTTDQQVAKKPEVDLKSTGSKARQAEEVFLNSLVETGKKLELMTRTMALSLVEEMMIVVAVEVVLMDKSTKDTVHGVCAQRFVTLIKLKEDRRITFYVPGCAEERRDLAIPDGNNIYFQVMLHFAVDNQLVQAAKHTYISRPCTYDKTTGAVDVLDTTPTTTCAYTEDVHFDAIHRTVTPLPDKPIQLCKGWRVFMRPRAGVAKGEKAESCIGQIELQHIRAHHPELTALLNKQAHDLCLAPARHVLDGAALATRNYHLTENARPVLFR
jgi:hypothetical protein